MTILIWIILIAVISIIWAYVALRREKNKKELNEARDEISKGRVIFHSSDSSESSSS